jgi:hypothetical protein
MLNMVFKVSIAKRSTLGYRLHTRTLVAATHDTNKRNSRSSLAHVTHTSLLHATSIAAVGAVHATGSSGLKIVRH